MQFRNWNRMDQIILDQLFHHLQRHYTDQTGNFVHYTYDQVQKYYIKLYNPSPFRLQSVKYDQFKAKILFKALSKIQWGFFTVYQQLFTVVVSINLCIVVAIIVFSIHRSDLVFLSNFAIIFSSFNVLVAVLIRNEHVINLLYYLFIPNNVTHLPLCFRVAIAKIYYYGGIHSGAAVSCAIWYTIFAAIQLYTTIHATDTLTATATATIKAQTGILSLIWLAFAVIFVTAYPKFRSSFHNIFEICHRFAGWTLLASFWIVLAISKKENLYKSPVLYTLSITFLLIIYPWTRLRRLSLSTQILSPNTAIFSVSLPQRNDNYYSCRVIRLSRSPLFDTHAFATIQSLDSSTSNDSTTTSTTPGNQAKPTQVSVLLSAAGDFTRTLISNPPKHIWARMLFPLGVVRVAALFDPVLLVATGAGIGPILSFLSCLNLDPPASSAPIATTATAQIEPAASKPASTSTAIPPPSRSAPSSQPATTPPHLTPRRPRIYILWSVRDPVNTYGAPIIAQLRRADRNAHIVDTAAATATTGAGARATTGAGARADNGGGGRRDMEALVREELERRGGAQAVEAVVVVANRVVVGKVVRGLRGVVPCFGPIWDS